MPANTMMPALRRFAIIGAISAVALVGAACSSDEDTPSDEATTTATSTTTATTEATGTAEATSTGQVGSTGEATATGEGTSEPTPSATPAVVQYECADGLSFGATVAQVPETWAIIEVDGETIEMEQEISGSGIRYSGDGYTYISKGRDARLELDGEVIRADCTEVDA